VQTLYFILLNCCCLYCVVGYANAALIGLLITATAKNSTLVLQVKRSQNGYENTIQITKGLQETITTG
jgi:hypothetical protein